MGGQTRHGVGSYVSTFCAKDPEKRGWSLLALAWRKRETNQCTVAYRLPPCFNHVSTRSRPVEIYEVFYSADEDAEDPTSEAWFDRKHESRVAAALGLGMTVRFVRWCCVRRCDGCVHPCVERCWREHAMRLPMVVQRS